MVSRLEIGDTFRQDGDFNRAEQFYREFIQDFPESDRLHRMPRIALVYVVALGRNNEALVVFDTIARENNDNPLYFVSASFQAWQAALRLDRFTEADSYFEAIRSTFTQSNLLSYASQELLASLPERYIDAANNVAIDDPWTAVSLLIQPLTLLITCNNQRRMALHTSPVRMFSNHWENGMNPLERLALIKIILPRILRSNNKPRFRWPTRKDLQENYDAAEELYLEYISLLEQEEGDEALWTQLWIADLYTAMQRQEESFSIWQDLSVYENKIGEIAQEFIG